MIYIGLASSQVKLLSHVQLFATPWTVAHQAPLFMGFSRHEYWSGLPFPSPGNLPNPGIKPGSPALQADSLLSGIQGKPCLFIKHLEIKQNHQFLGPLSEPAGSSSSFRSQFQGLVLRDCLNQVDLTVLEV